MSLLSTDLAVATAGNILHLFFQNGTKILEARSPDGGSAWTTQDEVIAEDGNYSGSAMTAYFVDKDADYGSQQTIHLLYINSSSNLVEKVKRMSGDKPVWEDIPLADAVKKGPEMNSRMTGGAWNGKGGWNPTGSQWVYFASIQDGKQAITEIRRTPKGAWNTETLLPQNWGDALPGTDLACTISNGSIKVFFQDHDYNIAMYESQDSVWHDRGVYIDKSKVQPTTPLAATRSEDGKTHVFYAGKTGKIVHSIDGKDSQDLINFYPGSKLGATSVGNKLTLFYRSLNPVGEVVTHENDNGSWKPGVTVIQA